MPEDEPDDVPEDAADIEALQAAEPEEVVTASFAERHPALAHTAAAGGHVARMVRAAVLAMMGALLLRLACRLWDAEDTRLRVAGILAAVSGAVMLRDAARGWSHQLGFARWELEEAIRAVRA